MDVQKEASVEKHASIHCTPSSWIRCATTIRVELSFLKVRAFLSFHIAQETRRTREIEPPPLLLLKL
jgi:hypothetical protein